MFSSHIKVYGHRIHRLARRLSLGDPDLADDLEQEARIAVWRFDSARVRSNEAAILMRIARDAMLKWRRRENAANGRSTVWRRPPVRQVNPVATDPKIVPIRRGTPRHRDATPGTEQRAA